jgi:lysophospholipase L1-like esterase
MRRPLPRLALCAAAGLLASVAFAGPATAAPYSSYVALGDSYSSGSLIPDQVDLLCTRSNHNYPSLVAKAIKPGKVTDVTCGGAVTKDMTGNQFLVVPPQFDALKASTSLVTVGIGGNDVPFAEVVATCGLLGVAVPHGSPCRDHYTAGGTDQLAAKVHAVGPKVDAVLKGIAQRSPDAKVVLVGYPTILPDNGGSCWPLVPISDGDAPYLRDVTKLLNEVLAEQAAANDVTFVDTYTSSVGHDLCQAPGTKWVEGLLPTSPAAPVHPNALGAKNQAAQVVADL